MVSPRGGARPADVRSARMTPATRWSHVLASRQGTEGRRAALEQLLPIYWRPLYVYARRQGLAANHAEDAVQGFFLHLLEWVDPVRVNDCETAGAGI